MTRPTHLCLLIDKRMTGRIGNAEVKTQYL